MPGRSRLHGAAAVAALAQRLTGDAAQPLSVDEVAQLSEVSLGVIRSRGLAPRASRTAGSATGVGVADIGESRELGACVDLMSADQHVLPKWPKCHFGNTC